MKQNKYLLLFSLIFLVLTLSNISAQVRVISDNPASYSPEFKTVPEGEWIKTNNYPVFFQNFTKLAENNPDLATRGLIVRLDNQSYPLGLSQPFNITIIATTTNFTNDSSTGYNLTFHFGEVNLTANTTYAILYDQQGASYLTGSKLRVNPINLLDVNILGGANDCVVNVTCNYQDDVIRKILSLGITNVSLNLSAPPPPPPENQTNVITGNNTILGAIVGNLVSGLPNGDDLTSLEGFSIALILIFIVSIIMLIALRNHQQISVVLTIIVDVLLFIFFVFLNYIKFGAVLLVVVILILAGITKWGRKT